MPPQSRASARAALLARVHAIEVDGDPLDVVGAAEAYGRRVEAAGSDDDDRRLLDELHERARAHHRARSVATLGHNDPTAGNVVGDDDPLLIDWEYAAPSDPAFDLATVLALHGIAADGRAAFLTAYAEQAATSIRDDRLRETERLVVLLAWAWARAERADRPDDPRASAWLRAVSAVTRPGPLGPGGGRESI